MTITLNGEKRDIDAATVRELVDRLGLAGQAVAVEINRQVIPRKQHDATPLTPGDTVELVTLVGGG